MAHEIGSVLVEPSHSRQTKRILSKVTEEFTINKLRLQQIGFYGRDTEHKTLLECLKRVERTSPTRTCSTGDDITTDDNTKELVWIRGFSGTGKTVLAQTLRPSVQATGGAFVQGKFDKSNHQEPYMALQGACREIVGKLLLETTEIQTRIRTQLVEEVLGHDASCWHLLTTVVPDLQDFLGAASHEYNAARDTNLAASSRQLQHVVRLFVRAMCTHYHPLVLLMDDVQWADMASLALLEALVTDRDNAGLLILCCYRSNEINDTHILNKTRRDLAEKSEGGGFGITDISIGNLDLDQVHQIIMALLAMDNNPERTKPLAEICHKRTDGNPFFLVFLMTMLEREGYLKFNLGTLKWTWKLEMIEEATTLAENVVVDTMQKITGVHGDLCKLLQIAAMLGSRFDKNIVCLVWKNLYTKVDEAIVTQCLEKAIKLSFLEPARKGTLPATAFFMIAFKRLRSR